MADLRIIVLEGDETGQELLDQALRVLDPAVTQVDVQLDHYDLSLGNRRRTKNEVVTTAAAAIREAGLGIKAATITPEGADDVGSPNRILREQIDGKVIIRTGRRIPGVAPIGGIHYPISVCRMAVGDAYGGIPALPESFFIGRDGKIVDKIIGLRGKAEIEDSIRKALDTPAASTPAAASLQPQN